MDSDLPRRCTQSHWDRCFTWWERKKERRNRRASALNPAPRKPARQEVTTQHALFKRCCLQAAFLLQHLINNTLVNIVVFCAQRVIRRACTHLRPTYLHTHHPTLTKHTHELRAAPHNSGPSVKKNTTKKTACPDSCCLSWRESGSQTWLRKSQKSDSSGCELTATLGVSHLDRVPLTSSHLMNFPPFFSASWTDTGLSCSAWTPGLAPAMARDSLPGLPTPKSRLPRAGLLGRN